MQRLRTIEPERAEAANDPVQIEPITADSLLREIARHKARFLECRDQMREARTDWQASIEMYEAHIKSLNVFDLSEPMEIEP